MKIINIMAMSLDGCIAQKDLETDEERMESGFLIPEDSQLVKDLVSNCDAIIMGAKNLRACPKIWEIKNHLGVYPKWCFLTSKGFTPNLPFWYQNHIDRFLFSSNPIEIPNGSNVFYKKVNINNEAQEIYEFLKKQNCQNVLLFGGGHVNQLFYEDGLVDELRLTVSPMLIGKESAPILLQPNLSKHISLDLISLTSVRSHVFLHYRVLKTK